MKNNVRFLTFTAFFIALILLFGSTPFGLIPLGFVNVTLLAIPVVIGKIVLGIVPGLILGFCFGLISMPSMFGMTLTAPSRLASALVVAGPMVERAARGRANGGGVYACGGAMVGGCRRARAAEVAPCPRPAPGG